MPFRMLLLAAVAVTLAVLDWSLKTWAQIELRPDQVVFNTDRPWHVLPVAAIIGAGLVVAARTPRSCMRSITSTAGRSVVSVQPAVETNPPRVSTLTTVRSPSSATTSPKPTPPSCAPIRPRGGPTPKPC